MSLLHDLITNNNFEALRDLLRAGKNPNTADTRGNTPLHIAVWKKEEHEQESEADLQVVRELIHFGADVNHTDDSGNTALHFAVGFRKYKTMETLLKCNAGIDMQDILGNSAIHYAIDNFYMLQRKIYKYESPRDKPHTDLEAVKLLMKYHPNINICNSLSETPLIWAVKEQNLQIVQVLLKGGAIPSLSDYCDNGPLHYSLDRTEINVSIVTELLRHGSSHASKNNYSESPVDLYLERLRNAPHSEKEKAKYLFKLFVFRKNNFKNTLCQEIADISRKTNSRLCEFFWYCRFEIEQMKSAEVATGYTVYNLASRVFYYGISEEIPHSFDIFDKVLEKLKIPEYTIYIDMIVSGICREYLAVKTAETGYWVDRNGEQVEFLNSATRYRICYYLNNFEMFNLILAFSSGSSFFKICRICNMLYENVSM